MIKLIIPRTYEHHFRVYERPDRPGNWVADYNLPPQHGEEQVRRRMKVPGHTKEQRESWAARKRVALDRQEFDADDYRRMGVDPNDDSDDPTLRAFLPEFRKFREFGRKRPLSPRTIDSQEKIIARFLLKRVGDMKNPLADYHLSEISRRLIQDFAAELRKANDADTSTTNGLSAKSVNNVCGVVGRVLSIAVDREKLKARPKIDKLPIERKQSPEDALTLDETQRLWATCQGAHGRIIRVLILTGLRAMEVAALQWEDYDEKAIGGPFLSVRRQYNRYVRKDGDPEFRPPKCDSFRTIPVGEALREVLLEQKAETRLQDGLIFMTDKGRPFCNELIRKALNRACRRAGIRRVSPHCLRRTFISQTAMASGDLEATAKLAGQKEIRVTRDHYLRIEQPHLKQVMGKLEERLFGSGNSGKPPLVEVK